MASCVRGDCGKPFEPKVSFQKYCSKTCQNASARRRWISSHGGRQNILALSRQDVSVGKRFAVLKFAAKERGFAVELTRQDFERITNQPCRWCGGLLPKTGGGIDREDNSVGYTAENSVPCCTQCNNAKNTYSREAFLGWVQRVYDKNIREKE